MSARRCLAAVSLALTVLGCRYGYEELGFNGVTSAGGQLVVGGNGSTPVGTGGTVAAHTIHSQPGGTSSIASPVLTVGGSTANTMTGGNTSLGSAAGGSSVPAATGGSTSPGSGTGSGSFGGATGGSLTAVTGGTSLDGGMSGITSNVSGTTSTGGSSSLTSNTGGSAPVSASGGSASLTSNTGGSAPVSASGSSSLTSNTGGTALVSASGSSSLTSNTGGTALASTSGGSAASLTSNTGGTGSINATGGGASLGSGGLSTGYTGGTPSQGGTSGATTSSTGGSPADGGSPTPYCNALPYLSAVPVLDGVLDADLHLETIVPQGWSAWGAPLPAGVSATFAAAWHESGFYFLVQVTDPERNPAAQKDPVWQGDAIEIYIDHDAIFAPPNTFDAVGTRQFVVGAPATASSNATRADIFVADGIERSWSVAQWIGIPTASGYIVEAFIVSADLSLGNLQLIAGQTIGFDLGHDVSYPIGQAGYFGNRLGQYFLQVRQPFTGQGTDYPFIDTSVFCTPTLVRQ